MSTIIYFFLFIVHEKVDVCCFLPMSFQFYFIDGTLADGV